MVAAVEQRFGPINRLPATIEWLTDNGSCYIAGETRKFAREIGFEPLTTPNGESTIEWNGRGFRAYDQTRLCPRQSDTRCANRYPIAVEMVRPLQPTSPASRAGLSFAA
jgi:transposase InsO family protein